jgi:hypothetical protein
MFNSAVLNVVIGLVFIYLLYSLLATTINEAVASVFNLRAQKLEKAITRMLDDGIMHHHNIWSFLGDSLLAVWTKIKNFFLLFSFRQRGMTGYNKTLVEDFYNHPAIKYLGENKISNKPSYISAEFFSKALMDILKNKSGMPGAPPLTQIQAGLAAISDKNETKDFIQSMLADSNNDLEKFRASLEQWFNETMNRASGWYKKQSQKITFVIGFVLAVAFNVDTISIVKKLSNDPGAASALSEIAVKYAETHKDSTGQLSAAAKDTSAAMFAAARNQVNGDISNANSVIGLGWSIPSNTASFKCPVEKNALDTPTDSLNCKNCLVKINGWPYEEKSHDVTTSGKIRYVICMAFSSWRRLLGYFLTALAISFGAPFWFDLLNKFIQLRGAGKKPEEPAPAANAGAGKQDVKRVG